MQRATRMSRSDVVTYDALSLSALSYGGSRRIVSPSRWFSNRLTGRSVVSEGFVGGPLFLPSQQSRSFPMDANGAVS